MKIIRNIIRLPFTIILTVGLIGIITVLAFWQWLWMADYE